MADLWDNFLANFGTGSGATPQYQPEGYSGLSAAQAQQVNDQGWYTGTPAGKPPQSLWEKLAAMGGADPAKDLQKSLTDLGAPPKPLTGAALPPNMAAAYHAPQNPYFNPYRHLSLDPETALRNLMAGGLT